VIDPAKPRAAETPASSSAGDSPAAIDSLLSQSKWSEALAVCERVSDNPGDRDLAHLLAQTGTALVHLDRAEDAAVAFARCAVLFPDTPDADQALIQLAIVYRDHYRKSDTARRLLQRAIDRATAQGHDSAALLARELLGSL
jgi:tetratricopeptide (TPR) repeat protein